MLFVFSASNVVFSSPTKLVQVDDESTKPNILMVLIDDLGYTDLGAYGGNIKTPEMDLLAKDGILFTNAHANPSCAPTRASFLTGQDPHRVGLGSQNGVAPPGIDVNTRGYEGHLNGDFVSIAELLKGAGYQTFQIGKWHLGHDASQSPKALGFDKNYTLLDGAASHYSDMNGVSLGVSPSGKAQYQENNKSIKKLPDNFYSTKNYTQWLLDSLANRENKKAPFFAYLAYTAVHDPLHAPDDLILKYMELFSGGYEKLKNERIQGLVKEGLIADSALVSRWLTGTPSWNDLNETEQRDIAKRMAVYAAMLEYLDLELGRIVTYLKSQGEYENTLIVIMSDNGAATIPRTFYAKNAKDLAWQDKTYPKNDVASYGQQGSFATLGSYNAQALSGPYFGFKTNLHEGGTRVPMIVKQPQSSLPVHNDSFVHISYLYKTFAEYAGVDLSGHDELLGCSLKSVLEWGGDASCSDEFGMGYMGWRSYRKGDWKIVFVSKGFGGTGEYALYNLSTDPGEANNLASVYPDKVRYLDAKWLAYANRNNIKVVPMDKVNTFFDRVSNKFFEAYWGD